MVGLNFSPSLRLLSAEEVDEPGIVFGVVNIPHRFLRFTWREKDCPSGSLFAPELSARLATRLDFCNDSRIAHVVESEPRREPRV